MRIYRHRPHQLSAVVARERVERIAGKLAERFSARCRWDGDKLHVEHPAVHGSLTLQDAAVTLVADLSFPVSLMRAQVEAEIDRLMERELAP